MSEVNDKYIKHRTIGEGQFGTCLLSTRKEDGELVVLKKLPYGDDAIAEAFIMDRLSVEDPKGSKKFRSQHPNIITMYASFCSSKSIYIELEYMEGGSLAAFIEKRKMEPLENFFILRILRQMTSALCFIHTPRPSSSGRKYIIHRDVKPGNVLLNADKSVAKLADFGISVRVEEGEKVRGKRGTSAYLAPEVVDANEYDCSADMWALGCVLYELCERRRLFEGNNDISVQRKICSGNFSLPVESSFYGMMRMLLTMSSRSRMSSADFLAELNRS